MYNMLYPDRCEIEDEGARHLAKSSWPNLRLLSMG